jgi:hypothetical protein
VTDVADGTDGFVHDTNPDDPIAGAALTSEGDVDAERPQERLHPAQSAGELAGAFLGQPVQPSKRPSPLRPAPTRSRSADASLVGYDLVSRAELTQDEASMTAANDLAVRRALEAAGVEFIEREWRDSPAYAYGRDVNPAASSKSKAKRSRARKLRDHPHL